MDIWDKVKYKKVHAGKVEKDGHVYHKYTKVRRFSDRSKRFLGYLLLAALAAAVTFKFTTIIDRLSPSGETSGDPAAQ